MKPKHGRPAALHPIRSATLALLSTTVCFLIACTSPPPPLSGPTDSAAAIQEGVPGGVFVNTVEVWVEVIAIDTTQRKLTILLEDGKETTVKVGPEAVNLDQIRTGDLITATLTEETVVYLDEEGTSMPDGAAAMVTLAPKGSQPGGLVAATARVTATIWAINPTNRTVTLRFEDLKTKNFPVRADIDLSKHKVGEKVVFLVTEMIAISVEKR